MQRDFCESTNNQGEEVLHLPVIVEAAESSPQAAASACYQIRKFLGKDYYKTSHVQYNAVMLFRILSQNPGHSFTRNIDDKFVSTVYSLLKESKDPSVQQIMRDTLDGMERAPHGDPGSQQMVNMWRNMKGPGARLSRSPAPPAGGQVPQIQQPPSHDERVFNRHQLPPPQELASRLEESRNTSKILMQLVQSTPTEEVLSSDLLKEFAERCQAAQRSIQGYINCDSPPPDDDTLQTLIEVNEQLSLSLSRYQRGVLSARRAMGGVSSGTSPNPEEQAQRAASFPLSQATSQPEPRQQAFSPYGPAELSPIAHSNSMPLSAMHPPPVPPPKLINRVPVAQPSDPFADPAEQSHVHSQPPPQRPGTYFTNGVTQSYMGRQASAANGLTMHGADISEEDEPVHEIDSHSRVDRFRGPSNLNTSNANGYAVNRSVADDDDDDLYTATPVQERHNLRIRDV
ncbi:hypothetical protein MBLNU457_1470t2 [Dothideomycetes sp. NU457]